MLTAAYMQVAPSLYWNYACNYSAFMSHNVPAVNDVFAVAIRAKRSFATQQQKCGGAKRCRGRKPEHRFA
jgi:hypothetical protein